MIDENSEINGVTITITSPDGKVITPSYEAHSFEKVNEIVNETLKLISEGDKIEVKIY